jgi:hypothetical protein
MIRQLVDLLRSWLTAFLIGGVRFYQICLRPVENKGELPGPS